MPDSRLIQAARLLRAAALDEDDQTVVVASEALAGLLEVIDATAQKRLPLNVLDAAEHLAAATVELLTVDTA
ncbi:hypothetical protein [Nonomuraea sp. NPDC049141]|uniref:hypothetical protein n=1 Tax=Nonomuraea sp. NPDC049141 TaxID=3155500 RepID=UPI0034105C94